MKRYLIWFLLCLQLFGIPLTFASTVGPTAADTGTSEAGVNVAWTNPSRVTASDSSYAVAALSSGSPNSNGLQATTTAFSIGATDTINGITVTVVRKRGGSGTCIDAHAWLVLNGVDQTSGTDQKNGGNWSASNETITYGSSSDVWGLVTPTGALINGLATGIAIFANRTATSPDASIDYAEMTITYTVAGGGPTLSTRKTLLGVGK